jgi:hypothetical protein
MPLPTTALPFVVFLAAGDSLIDLPDDPVAGHVYETTEIVGVSPDLKSYAQRHVDYGHAQIGYGSDCSYPKVRGAEPRSVQLSLCTVGKGCPDIFAIYDEEGSTTSGAPAACTPHKVASARLAKAKFAFAAAGVDLSAKPTPLRTKSPALAGMAAQELGGPRDVVLEIPAQLPKAHGLSAPIELTSKKVRKGPVCGIVAQSKGAGSTVLYSAKRWSCVGGMRLKGAAITPDGKQLLVTYWTGHDDAGESQLHAEKIALDDLAKRILKSRK